MKVKCSDCKYYSFQKTCFMENCMWSPGGYCAPCACNNCDPDCLSPEDVREKRERPKFLKKTE